MVEPINLNRTRKAKATEAAKAQAAANRVKFGRNRAEKAAEKSARNSAAAHIAGHRRED